MDFMIGGVSAMCAGVFSNPLDVIKTRQQLQGELVRAGKQTNEPYRGIFRSIKSIIKAEGLIGMQKGLGPALSFQFVMNSVRLGIYQTVDNLNWTSFKSSQLNKQQPVERSFVLCIFWGGTAGVIGAFIASPLYMMKTQIQSQSSGGAQFAVGYQHQHTGAINGLMKIFNERGVKGLWRGCGAIVPRTAIASAAQLATFTNTKDVLLRYQIFQESVFLTASVASMISGFFTVVAMTPFDVVATRMFNQGIDQNTGKGLLYKNFIDCFIKTYKVEGLRGLYKGFVPSYWRTSPHTILHLTFWDQFKKWKDLYFSDEIKIKY